VVIAIIGILSSVVLASLNTARNKGADAAIKSNINNARAQAELYYDNHGNSYLNLCSATDGIAQFTTGATSAGSADVGCGVTASTFDNWAANAQLKGGTFYCVDSSGAATTTATDTVGIVGSTDSSCL
jgi:type II secretory pathway pseudopilin PulG